MFHRLLVIGIVAFWLAMTGLLLVRELYPEATRLNAVPVSYVGQLVFQHEQTSNLLIISGRKDIGYFQLQPHTDSASGRRILDMNGGVSVPLPNGRPQRLSWSGAIELSRTFGMERVRLNVSPSEAAQSMHLDFDLVAKTAKFTSLVGREKVNERVISLDRSGIDSLVTSAGIDPAMLQQLNAARSQIPEFTLGAQTSSTVVRGQKLTTFLLTLRAGGQVVLEAHLSQLGQVLRAQAPSLGMEFELPR
jgi:hypothetical protein